MATKKNPTIEELVKYFIDKRDEIRSIEVKHDLELGPEKKRLEACRQLITQYLQATKQESARTVYGTAALRTETSVSLSDPDAFIKYVKDNGAYELMDRRANKTAVLEFVEEHDKLPPGVRSHSYRTAGVTKPTAAQSERLTELVEVNQL